MTADAVARIDAWVRHWAEKTPAAEALVSNGRRIDYAELERLVDECARAFATRGIARGDRVAVLCTTRWESFVVFYALCRLGAAWVGLNPRHKLSELQYVVEDSAPTTLIGMAGFEDRDYRTELIALSTQCPSIRQSIALTGKIAGFDSFKAILNSATEIDDADYREAIDEVSGEDAACVVYTSGSTGKPKGALLPQRGLIAVQTGMAELYSVQPFRALNNFPMDHVGGLTDIALLGLVQGGTIILQERYCASDAFAAMVDERVTMMFQTVSQCLDYAGLAEFRDSDLSSLQLIMWGGEPVSAEVVDTWRPKCATHLSAYGMTESCGAMIVTTPQTPLENISTLIGQPIPGVEVALLDDTGEPVATGATGEICARGAVLMLGYLNCPEATAETIDAAGWLHSGDLAAEDAQGNIAFVGRKKEMFKSGGYNVYPREVEAVIEKQDGVGMTAVVAAPHPKFAEVGIAFVEPEPGRTVCVHDLNSALRGELANYKVPKKIVVRDKLPTLGSGKTDKKQLAAEVATYFTSV